MVDYTRTARRAPWDSLPQPVRERIAARLGQEVTAVELAGSGFTHGFAAVVRGASRALFAKAAPAEDDLIYPAYLREAAVLAELPARMPTPVYLGSDSVDAADGAWQVMFFEPVTGRMPGQPWTEPDLAAVHSALLEVERLLQRLPAALQGPDLRTQFAQDTDICALFGAIGRGTEPPPFAPLITRGRAAELQQLVDRSAAALRGTAVLHSDLRADNILISRDGQALFCDWNFLTTGPRWADWVVILAYAWLDGVDVRPWLAGSALTRDADPEDIDSWLAVLAAYMVLSGSRPEVPSSPLLREHARHSARMLTGWLAERRGWNQP